MGRTPTRVMIAACVALAGCAARPTQPTPPTHPPTSAPPSPGVSPTSAARPIAQPEPATVPGAEGLAIAGTYTPGTSGAAVLLLHMYGSDRESWRDFAATLAEADIASLAIDLRGHGETGDDENWSLAQQDVEAAFAWLSTRPGIDPSRLGVAGASIGANLALVLAANPTSGVRAAALLSPGLDYFRVQIVGLAGETPGVDLFLAASEQDGYSAQTVRLVADEAPSAVTLEVLDGGAHGTDMFFSKPELMGMLVGFFEVSLSG